MINNKEEIIILNLKLYEYNVSPDIERKRSFIIEVNKEKLYVTGYQVKDNLNTKFAAVEKLIIDNLEKIASISQKDVNNYKGGRQESLTINYNGYDYEIIENTDDLESKTLYNELKEKLLGILV